jgi:hypothetical protein
MTEIGSALPADERDNHDAEGTTSALVVTERLEYLRTQLEAECISWGELHELQGLAEHIAPGDVQLLEAAGVPEHAPYNGPVIETFKLGRTPKVTRWETVDALEAYLTPQGEYATDEHTRKMRRHAISEVIAALRNYEHGAWGWTAYDVVGDV